MNFFKYNFEPLFESWFIFESKSEHKRFVHSLPVEADFLQDAVGADGEEDVLLQLLVLRVGLHGVLSRRRQAAFSNLKPPPS